MFEEHARPHVLCFHCQTAIYPKTLAERRQYRTEYGIDMFQCPSCSKDFKIDPRDFLDLREKVVNGSWPADSPPAITGLDPSELTPYELIEARLPKQKNKAFILTPTKTKLLVTKLYKIGIVFLLAAIAVIWITR